ncbi:YcnI family protein [Agromyces sp. NPDC058136]|uniref:YcnI family copper-binding membrane protein n=1 Tax=Agromyces sp. NPDC058136 TaxID=3346354 RepID=UPI0036D777E4
MSERPSVRPALVTAAALGAGALLALGAPLAASAHVGVESTSTAAGAYTVLGFGIPHGCGESPTTKLTFTIPEGIDRVTPTVNPGWTIEKVIETLPEPKTDSHGANVVERVSQVVYTAVTPLPSDLRDVIELSLQLPADAEGETLEFPVLQECAEGSTDWSAPVVEGEEEPEHPAPSITVTAAEPDGHHGGVVSASEHGDADASAASSDAAAASADDEVARALGITGIVVGVAGLGLGLAVALGARRSRKSE